MDCRPHDTGLYKVIDVGRDEEDPEAILAFARQNGALLDVGTSIKVILLLEDKEGVDHVHIIPVDRLAPRLERFKIRREKLAAA